MRVYISGGITGCPGYFQKFAEAEKLIRAMGHFALNPTTLNSVLPDDMEYEEYMKIDFAMLGIADAIYMLPGWRESRGANREYGYALGAGLIIAEDLERLGTGG